MGLKNILCGVVVDTVQVPRVVFNPCGECSTDHGHGPVRSENSDEIIVMGF